MLFYNTLGIYDKQCLRVQLMGIIGAPWVKIICNSLKLFINYFFTYSFQPNTVYRTTKKHILRIIFINFNDIFKLGF